MGGNLTPGYTALHQAVFHSSTDIVALILGDSRFVAHDAIDPDGNTALLVCATRGNGQIAKMLLEDPQFTLVNNIVPTLIVREFSSGGAITVENATVLHSAANADNAEVCEALLQSPKFTGVGGKTRSH